MIVKNPMPWCTRSLVRPAVTHSKHPISEALRCDAFPVLPTEQRAPGPHKTRLRDPRTCQLAAWSFEVGLQLEPPRHSAGARGSDIGLPEWK